MKFVILHRKSLLHTMEMYMLSAKLAVAEQQFKELVSCNCRGSPGEKSSVISLNS